jgi:hypothetical protein
MLRKDRKTMGGADVSAQVKEYKLLQRERALRTASVTFG